MSFEWKALDKLTLGVNLRSLSASRTSVPGEAQDAVDVFPREDGAITKSMGWLRRNATALNGRPVACRGFTYRGKNTVAGDTRPGNLGLANDGADFIRRKAEYPGFLVLTDATAYVWDPTIVTAEQPDGGFVEVDPTAQAQAFVINPETKPTIEAAQENCYVVGWATVNLRFDPVDRVWYQWGWEQVPFDPVLSPAEGDLIGGAVYQYGVSFQDNYTGEESKMSDSTAITIAADGGGTLVNLTDLGLVYNGDRHFHSTGQASDVSLVVWRTGADDDSFRFLDVLLPGVTSLIDDGLARETSLRPYQGTQVDEPRFSALRLFKGSFFALSKSETSHRVYRSSLDKTPFLERWRPLDFNDLEVPEGEVLTAIGGTDSTMLVYSQRGCFRTSISVSTTHRSVNFQRMPWHVGAVGPIGRGTVDGWEYFLSERGPYRWREGMTVPQNIGENLLPIFVENTSGLCKLNAKGKELAEVNFDWTTNTVVFAFAIGDSEIANQHWRYWIESDRLNGSYKHGWWSASPDIQAMDLSSSLSGLDGSDPESPRERKQEIVFCDRLGYVYEYRLGSKRGGLVDSAVAITTVQSLVDSTTIEVPDALYILGDGLAGMRLELESQPDANGKTTCESYEIASNTVSQITAASAFTRSPVAGDDVRIAGIPAFWRSWFDHLGNPHQEKTMMDFSVGYQDRNNPNGSLSIGIGAASNQFPTAFVRTAKASMGEFRKKFTVARTGAYWFYEFANSIPDELFVVTDFEREVELVRARRKA